ncbi:ABC transporter permease subunit [Marinomonas sp. 15G1-11]|uniref:Arginine ABC transporter permease protein ArtM n=1 Tax=Marinomonas phaeophyticola TaxID=3004091 RepID=A0ABT4JWC1_9GAMM|nr:ABC transporter permease subunit [Marinomonas sp. 15G1-11]MCZ2722608.1 ABC transporter permease subunit [Marinomonas sp. 15G1-11]
MGHETARKTRYLFGIRWLFPHRMILLVLLCLLVFSLVTKLDWYWIAEYKSAILSAVWKTILLLVSTFIVGFILAVPIGLVQVTGPRPLAMVAHSFCSIIRGTPLLLQIWIFYYGFGSVFPEIEGIRESFIWPFLTSAWPYAFFALTLSVMAYEGEVLRGALSGVPKGELEAAKAMGMKPFKILTRIWLPRAIQRTLPIIGGEVIIQLKATPLVATITIIDTYAIFSNIRLETYIVYEPLLLMTLIYLILAGAVTLIFTFLERQYKNR